jgi:hypothetical protein
MPRQFYQVSRKIGPLLYQMRIELQGTNGSIWRRLLVPSNTYVRTLHGIINITMGWKDRHLYEFKIAGKSYGIADPESPGMIEDRLLRVARFKWQPGDAFTYVYDFGDWWRHDVTIEAIEPNTRRRQRARCIDGAGACPPEDIGGIPGFERFLHVRSDLTYDPARFDAKSADVGISLVASAYN